MSTFESRSAHGLRGGLVRAAACGLGLSAAVLPMALRAEGYAPMVASPVLVGPQFKAPCGPGFSLTGVELRVGEDVDAIRPLCARVLTPRSANAAELTEGSGLVANRTGILPTPELAPGWFGGPGGNIERLFCPKGTPVVAAIRVGIEFERVNTVHLYCTEAASTVGVGVLASGPLGGVMQRPLPSAVFDGEQRRPLAPDAFSQCPPGQFAVGVYGRTVYNDDPDRRGVYLGALGLMCDAPRVESPGTYVARVGRYRNGSAGPEKSICDKARDAAARNSPAATQLALLCKVRPKMPLSGARIATSGVGVRAPSAGGARADAPPDLDALAARGAELAAEDPLATTLRDAQGEGDLRRAFDIGAGISEGQTAWGPGKQRVRDALPPAERDAYSIATSYFLDRNRHADRIAIGMEIAAADPEVAARRTAEADARFTVGFDVAAAIFGDPALGAQGNEVMGPGARSIRDALSAEVTKRGFDAAYEFLHARR